MESTLGIRSNENSELGIGVAVTQLQDIKEEEDVELTRLHSGVNDSSSVGESQMSGTKPVDEKIEYGVSVAASGASSVDEEKQAPGSRSRDDLSLLPPLPNTFEKVVEDEAGQQGPLQDHETHKSDEHFDLSKALEIPVSHGNNAETSTIDNGGSDSSLPLTPKITSPKLSLKKKFSNATPVAFPTPREGSPGEIHDSRAHSVRSKSNSNATAFQHILPALNLAIEATANDHHHHHYHHYQVRRSQDRRSIRKFSFGDSSSDNSSNSLTDAELLYRMPPPSLNRTSNSRSRSNSGVTASFDALTNPTTAMNTPTASILEGEPGSKKVPLLRRASSAILRKASLRGKTDILRSSSASTTPVLQNKPFFETQRTPPNANRYTSSMIYGDNNSDDDLQYVTQIEDTSRPCSRNPSIRSRVRRGFSRIMSSGSVCRVPSSASLRDFSATDDVSTTPVTSERRRYDNEDLNGSSRRSSPLESRKWENISSGTPVSASTFLSPVNSKAIQLEDHRAGMATSNVHYNIEATGDKGNLVGNGNGNGNGVKQGTNSSSTTREGTKVAKSSDDDIGDDVTVDLDKLTQSIPVITVTDNVSSKHLDIQVQSNITLDEVYRGKNYKHYRKYIGGTRDRDDDSKKPEMMTLREYVEVLVKQQQIEDERLAVLEKNFRDSGWCSKEDLMNLKQKRIMISKKWAERISFYQNKLDL